MAAHILTSILPDLLNVSSPFSNSWISLLPFLQLCSQNKLPPDFIFHLLEEGPVCVLLPNLFLQLSFPIGMTHLINERAAKTSQTKPAILVYLDLICCTSRYGLGCWQLSSHPCRQLKAGTAVFIQTMRSLLFSCILGTFFTDFDRTAAVPGFCHVKIVTHARGSHPDLECILLCKIPCLIPMN